MDHRQTETYLGVSASEFRVVIQCGYGSRELRHWVKGVGQIVQQGDHVLWKGSALGPLTGQLTDLVLGWYLTSTQKPEQTFGKGFQTTFGFWQYFLAFGDGEATETDTLIGVQNGCFRYQSLDAAHTTVQLEEKNCLFCLIKIEINVV